jgi:hypothetical protein
MEIFLKLSLVWETEFAYSVMVSLLGIGIYELLNALVELKNIHACL